MRTQTTTFRNSPVWDWQGSAGSIPGTPSYYHLARGNQDLIISESHNVSRLGQGDQGGPFHCVKRTLTEANFGPTHNRTVLASDDANTSAYNYKGYYRAKYTNIASSDFPVPPIALNSELDALGTTAIARSLPTNPLAGLATMLGELRSEGLPSIVGASSLRDRSLRARNAGGEYLNAEFGWRPLVNDVLSLAHAICDSDELLRKYEQESGKLLHRRYTFPDEITTEWSETSDGTANRPVPAIRTAYWSGTGTLKTVKYTRIRRWFSGAFTYYLAPQGSLARAEQLAAKRLGTRITPEVLWNLAPWTWAADWVSNIGDVIHNVSAFANDGLVMPYAYMMKESTISMTYFHSGAKTKRYGLDVACWQELETKRKQRRRATPYGFGLDPINFTNRQWAILGALGLSKAPAKAL